jgi:(3S)-linalool synthase
VQALLRQHPKRTRGVLATVDHLKRLCIDHYFQDEIDNVVNSCVDLIHSGNLQDAALSMRLMREAGYSVSAGQQNASFSC